MRSAICLTGVVLVSTAICSADAGVPRSSSTFALQLKDGTRLIGVPGRTGRLSLDAAFGRVDIPLELIQSVEFTADPEQTGVRFKNGDLLTGHVVLGTLEFRTAYGDVTIPTDDLLRLSAGDKFSGTSPHGGGESGAKTRNRAKSVRRANSPEIERLILEVRQLLATPGQDVDFVEAEDVAEEAVQDE